LIEHGGPGGKVAGPVAKAILEGWATRVRNRDHGTASGPLVGGAIFGSGCASSPRRGSSACAPRGAGARPRGRALMRGGVGISASPLPRAQIGMTRWRRFRAAVDWPLVATIVVIAALGLLNLYSAVNGTRHAGKFDQQLRWMFVGAIAFAAFTAIDYRSLLRVAWIGFGVALVALIIVDVGRLERQGQRAVDLDRHAPAASRRSWPSWR
jgi:hypothetical protein